MTGPTGPTGDTDPALGTAGISFATVGSGTIVHGTATTSISTGMNLWLQGVEQTTSNVVGIHSFYFTDSGGTWLANLKVFSPFGTGSTDYTVYFYSN
jgi:hypothetical protein